MLKKNLNEMIFTFTVVPEGPILIKSGIEGGADPAIPDMNFVRTINPKTGISTVYLPGSSLKGVFRSYAEKICRTAELEIKDVVADPNVYEGVKKEIKGNLDKGFNTSYDSEIYRCSCPVSKVFGSQILASRIRFKDAFPEGEVKTEQRTNVSINRVLGSVQAGPFNMEVVTGGKFKGEITLRNFELWQIGLLGLIFRDFNNGKLKIGYAKTRGLGDVKIALHDIEIKVNYSRPNFPKNEDGSLHKAVFGLDKLLTQEECNVYSIKSGFDNLSPTVEETKEDEWGINVHQNISGEKIEPLFKECVQKHFSKFIEETLKDQAGRQQGENGDK